jgi:hypothetical protein
VVQKFLNIEIFKGIGMCPLVLLERSWWAGFNWNLCFILFLLMRSTEAGCFRLCSWFHWKALKEKGCISFGFVALGLVVQKFLNIEWFSSLEIILNGSWNFWRNWNVCLWCCWKDLDEQDLMEFYLVRFEFRMWETLIFKYIL